MKKKHYFLNSIYLFICATFIVLASILNFNDSTAENQSNPIDIEIGYIDDSEAEKNTKVFSTRNQIEKRNSEKPTTSFKSSRTSTYGTSVANSQAPTVSYSSYINIAGKILRIEDVKDTLIDSTDHVNRWGKKFLYGHNSTRVFGAIRNLPVGTTFTALIDSEEHTYQISYTETLEKPVVEQNMLSIAYAIHDGDRYDLSLMTCAGKSLGGGDATHRFIAYARRIS